MAALCYMNSNSSLRDFGKIKICPTCNNSFNSNSSYCQTCMKKYREKRVNEKEICECGSTYNIYTKVKHLNSKKHKIIILCKENNIDYTKL